MLSLALQNSHFYKRSITYSNKDHSLCTKNSLHRQYCTKKTRKSHNVEKGMFAKGQVSKVSGKSASSSQWLQRKAGDQYTRLAHEEGYIARSAYKLQQILYQNRDIKGSVIVDLGAAPGGWTTVAQKKFPKARIIAVDIKPMEYIPNTTQLVMDFTGDDAPKVLAQALAGRKVDILLSDMAPAFSGQRSIDHLRLMGLVEVAWDFGKYALSPGGHLIFKVNRGGTEAAFKKKLEFYFESVQFSKPDASYKDSSEMYIIGKRYYGKGGKEAPTPKPEPEMISEPLWQGGRKDES